MPRNSQTAAPTSTRRRRLVRIASALVATLVAGWLGLSLIVATSLTQRAHPIRAEIMPRFQHGTWEEVRLSTDDGESLGAWYSPGDADHAVVLLFHGNGGSRTAAIPQAEWLAERGFGVLVVTLRAHGDSTGDYNDVGFSSRLDVLAAVDWVVSQNPDRTRVVWGQSVGGAAAVLAAAEIGDRVDGYVLECVFADLKTAVWNRLQLYLPPVLDHAAYWGLICVSPLATPHLDEISPVLAATEVPVGTPVLVLAGSADQRATVGESRRIAAAIGDRAELLEIAGGDHVKLLEADSRSYFRAVSELLNRAADLGP